MSVNDVGRHAWEALRHEVRSEIGIVANTAVHHLVVAFCPGGTMIIPAACLMSKGKTIARARKSSLTG